MKRVDNYQIQAQQARDIFLGYDQQKLIRKLGLAADEAYLYTKMLDMPYRIDRRTGQLQRQEGDSWQEARSHGEVMTLLDLVCDSREDRFLSGRWKNMSAFGLMFHQNMLEERADPFAAAIQQDPRNFLEACRTMGGTAIPGGDLSAAVELFDGLRIGIVFWAGDEEFAPRVRFLWDENALMYLKYETMHFALGMLKSRILEKMKDLTV